MKCNFFHWMAGTSVLLLIVAGCKKKADKELPEETPALVTTPIKSGLNENPKSIDGYFYASYSDDQRNGSQINTLFGFSSFGEPAKNLLTSYDHQRDQVLFVPQAADQPNISVSSVQFSGNMFISSASPTNCHNQIVKTNAVIGSDTKWISGGNKTFTPIDTDVPRGFPILKNTSSPQQVDISAGYTVDIPSIASNYDSICVRISNYYYEFGSGVQKTVGTGVNTIVFSSAELSSQLYPSFYSYISYKAFNYSNQTISSKVYVFELGMKHHRQLVIVQ